MCGLLGIISNSKIQHAESMLTGMLNAIEHRGPDDSGIYLNDAGNLALGHRRLSIQDLSPLGHQPMSSRTSRYVVVYNGEVYNFKTLKAELVSLGHTFAGGSDTEVLLAGFEQWGVIPTIEKCVGMFAIAVFDQDKNSLTLIRDRHGEKPLYYSIQSLAIIFASELHVLKACELFDGEVESSSLSLLLRHNFIPAPHTIYKNTYKLLPGHYIEIDLNDPPRQLVSQPYWSLNNLATTARDISFADAVQTTENLLLQSVEQQLISDAPIGAFLSGGVDSSTIVALMQSLKNNPVKTFSIGFNEAGFNEAEHAKAVAKYLGTDHTELYVSGKDALDLVPKIPQIYDEPFADSSQLPTFLLCQMAKKDVTVALSGDGGDELFCGYSRYFQYQQQWQNRHAMSSQLKARLNQLPNHLAVAISRLLHAPSKHLDRRLILEKLAKQSNLLSADMAEFYRKNVSLIQRLDQCLLNNKEPDYALNQSVPAPFSDDSLRSMMWQDLNWYLPDDILVKVDRAAMANSLETRVPMLDHRIVEFAMSLPPALNVKNGVGKQVLRSVLFKHVPPSLIERPKVGFAIPIDQWLRGELKDWAFDLLSPNKLKNQGYFNSEMVQVMLNAHVKGLDNYGYQLWGMLMFQQWLEH